MKVGTHFCSEQALSKYRHPYKNRNPMNIGTQVYLSNDNRHVQANSRGDYSCMGRRYTGPAPALHEFVAAIPSHRYQSSNVQYLLSACSLLRCYFCLILCTCSYCVCAASWALGGGGGFNLGGGGGGA